MPLGPPAHVFDIDPDPEDPRAGELLSAWDGDPVDVGVVGVPFDGCVPGRKGCREGPAGIRKALRYNTTYDAERDVELSDLDVCDLGDLEIRGDASTVHDDLGQVLGDVRDRVDVLVLLGGDHSLTHPTVAAWSDVPAGLVYVDAHLDVRRFPPWSSGNSFRRLIDDDVVPGPNLVNLGARPFLNSAHHVGWAEKAGATVHPPSEIRDRGATAVAAEATSTAADGADRLHFSLDVDGIDQSHAPGASAPSPGGLHPREVFEVAWTVGRHPDATSMDVCEVAPRLDPTGNTSRVAATAVLHFLAGVASR